MVKGQISNKAAAPRKTLAIDSIHKRDRHDGKENALRFYSQYGQDRLIYQAFFKDKKEGCFLEIGADDGVDKSNSLFFEQSLGWKGMCIEPRPNAFAKLKTNRKCICENYALSTSSGKQSFLSIEGWGKGLSGLINNYEEQHKQRIQMELASEQGRNSQTTVISVPTIKVGDLLDKHQMLHIDFLSLDTEGSELDILKTIDFGKYTINVCTIENNYGGDEVRSFLTRRGFLFYGKIGIDDVFVNKDFQREQMASRQSASIDQSAVEQEKCNLDEIEEKIRPNIRALIPPGNYTIKQMDPIQLLHPKRFDLMAKYLYAQHRHLNIKSDWAKRLYLAHLHVFNGFHEPDGTGKTGPQAFLNAFEGILDSIQRSGYKDSHSLVPVGRDDIIMDGSHRVAACMLYKQPLKAMPCEVETYAYDYQFFKNFRRHVKTGLTGNWLDAMALTYAGLKDNTYIVSVFPSAPGNDDLIRSILEKCGDIVYEKSVSLRNQGPNLLMRQIYSGEEWIGNRQNNFIGARQKARLCFTGTGPVRVFLLQSNRADRVDEAKQKIRSIFNIGKHSVHINDTHEETLRLAKVFFNENSIHFLNHADPKYFIRAETLLDFYRQWLGQRTADRDRYCIDGSFVMAAYGIRDARDLDFLSANVKDVSTGNELVSCHNDEIHHYTTSRDDILFNPENHFYFDGIKFANLDVIRSMKTKRNEQKDRRDVALIDSFLDASRHGAGVVGTGAVVSGGLDNNFDETHEHLINFVYPHTQSSGFTMKKGDFTVIWSTKPIEGCALYYFQDAFSFREIDGGIKVLGMHEPIVVLPNQYTDDVWNRFDFVLTSLDSLVARGGIFEKFYHPAFDAPHTSNRVKAIDLSYCTPLHKKKKAICMIAGNKSSQVPGELYSLRVAAARWFNEHSDIPFDVFGRPAFNQLPNYRGELDPYEKKFEVLSGYRYALCFENIFDPVWSKGYLTEKILHCLMCGTVPIYYGCYNVEDYIPADCYIDYRQFDDLSALNQYLHRITDADYRIRLDKMRSWVAAGNLGQYSIHHVYDKLASLANPDASNDLPDMDSWRPAPIPDAVIDNNLSTSPVLWTWNYLAGAEADTGILKQQALPSPALNHLSSIKNETVGIIFSKDRALQLDGTLNSFFYHCQDRGKVALKVLFTTSDKRHERLYIDLKATHAPVEFVRENDFRNDILKMISGYRFVMFLVDDNIFVRDFTLSQAVDALQRDGDVLGCTMRLGTNTTMKLHPKREALQMPRFLPIGDTLLKFDWTVLKPQGFGYPCELQSAIYRISDVGSVMANNGFTNPNTLEALLDRKKNEFRDDGKTHQLCYTRSVCFTNPINLVQTAWKNWNGGLTEHSTDSLALKFEERYRIDVAAYNGMTPIASHQIVNLLLKEKDLPFPDETSTGRMHDPDVWRDDCWMITPIPNSYGMVDVNGIKGFLSDGDMRTLSEHAGDIPPSGTVVEIGSFMGLSAIVMGQALMRTGNEAARIHCVDPWDSSYLSKFGMGGEKTLREIFESNIERAGVDAMVLPIQKRSVNAAVAFEENSIDLLFIDGDHAYESCFADLCAWFPKVKPGGIILGHDCRSGSGVMQAVDQFVEKFGLEYELLRPPTANCVFKIRIGSASNAKTDSADTDVKSIDPGHQQRLTSILIVNFNGDNCIEDCISGIRRHTPEHHEIIVIDNASTDESAHFLRKLHDITLIENSENKGCPPARAQALKIARGDVVVFLDNDAIVTPGWLKGIHQHFDKDPGIGLIGPRSNFVSGPQLVKRVAYQTVPELDALAERIYRVNRGKLSETHRLVGFCLAANRAVIDKIGNIDDKFGKFGFEDDDYTWRAIIAGFKAVIAHDVFIHHSGGPQVKGDPVYNKRLLGAWAYFKKKWGLPDDLAYGDRYDREKYLSQAFDPGKHYIPIQGHWENSAESPTMKEHWLDQVMVECELLALKGKPAQALENLVKAIKRTQDQKRLFLFGAEFLNDSGFHSESEALLNHIPADDRDIRWAELMAYSMEGQEKLETAGRLVERGLAEDASSSSLLNLKGVIAFKSGLFDDADHFLRKSIEAGAKDGRPYCNYGLLKISSGETAKGLDLVEEGFRLTPQIEEIADSYHSMISDAGDFARALPLFSDACQRFSASKRLQYLLIDILLNLQKTELAIKHIESAISVFGADDGILGPALKLRESIGPMRIDPKNVVRPTITLCMIVRDEANSLAGALESVKGFVDEIVVVDTGSVDETRDIARVFGATVFEFVWNDNFSDARNEALSKAEGDWILVLDADEQISPSDGNAIKALINGSHGRDVSYSFTTRNYVENVGVEGWQANEGQYIEEQGSGWYPSNKVRMFPNVPTIRFENAVHEKVDGSLDQSGIEVLPVDVPIHHFGELNPDFTDQKKRTYYQLGQKKLTDDQSLEALVEHAIQAGETGDFSNAITLWSTVLTINPGYAKGYFNMGYAYINLGLYEKAKAASAKALEIDPELKEASLNLSLCELRTGDIGKSIEILETFLTRFPDHPMAVGNLGVAYCTDGQKKKGNEYLNQVTRMGFDSRGFVAQHAQEMKSAGKKNRARALLAAAANVAPGAGEARQSP
jgi:FkbM family methyltransferase